MYRTLLCLSVAIVFAPAAMPQSATTATLSGTISDASEAVVPKAKVTVSNPATGLVRDVMSDSAGEYRLVLLPPGTYTVKAEKEGFAPQSHSDIVLTVGQSASLDFRLAVGTATQVVEIQSAAPLVDTDRTQQANTITQQSVQNLPINRRDYLSFSLLAPGVGDSQGLADANSFRVKQTPDSGLSFYGSNGRGNNVNVDGGESNDGGGGVRPTVTQEAVQEFQVNRTNYAAEYGAARGGVVNIITKSGSNAFRGTAFAFFRHQSLDATNPFALDLQGSTVVRVKPDSNRQQFGGSFGGPVKKDRTFFFMAYEQLRRRESAAVPVLTDMSIFQPTAAQQRIIDGLPASVAATLRGVLTSPQSTIDMFKANSGIFPFRTNQYQALARLDHRFSDANQVTLRFNVTDSDDQNPNLSALTGVSRGYRQSNFDVTGLIGWIKTLSPSLVNDFRGQWNYNNPITASNDPYGPALEIAGYGFFNRDRFLPANIISRRPQLADSLTWIKGSHTVKAGVDFIIRNEHSDSATFMSGRFTFGTLPGALLVALIPGGSAIPGLAQTPITALQSFNLGLAQSYQQGFGDPIVRATFPLYAGFAQDTWKVRPNLTLDFGVRWEADHRKSPLPSNNANFSPRLGFAWDPFNDHKTTIRGGYGLFYAPIDFQIDYVVNALGEINGYRQIAQVLTTFNSTNPLNTNGPVNIFQTLRRQGIIGVPTPQRPILAGDLAQFGITISQTGARPPLTVLFRNTPNYRNPLAEQASFGIERALSGNISFSASYVFVRGSHLTTSHDDNLLAAPVNPATGIRDWGATADNPTGTKYFRNPLLFQENLYESTANSFYHGLMVEMSHRFSRNLTLNGNYTFSKAIDETVDYNSDFQANDQTCRRCERALSSFDQRHKLVVYGVVQSPASSNRLFSNWILTPIYRYNSAHPFNLLAGTELNNDRHNTTDRPYFAGRNTGIGPSFWTFDTRLTRRFELAEHRSLDLMFEGFNLFNHLNYMSVNNTVGNMAGPFRVYGRDDRNPSQPLGFTSAFDPRRIQLGLRFNF